MVATISVRPTIIIPTVARRLMAIIRITIVIIVVVVLSSIRVVIRIVPAVVAEIGLQWSI
jgi:hypothetical protein